MKTLLALMLLVSASAYADDHHARSLVAAPPGESYNVNAVGSVPDAPTIAAASAIGYVACDAMLNGKIPHSGFACAGLVLIAGAVRDKPDIGAGAIGVATGAAIRYSWKF